MEPTTGPKRGSTRTKARKRALDILFEADLRELPALEILAAHSEAADPPVREFTAELVRGVVANSVTIDDLISESLSTGWTLERMPRVDRNLARLAIFEARQGETPFDVVLAEAVALCQELSTDESPAFLNGLLSSALARTAG